MNVPLQPQPNVLDRLIARSNGLLMRGHDPRVITREKTSSTGATAEPALDTNISPTTGANDNGQAK